MPRTALTFPERKTVENLLTNGDFEYAPPFTAAQNTTQRFIDGTASGSANNYSPYTWGFSKGNTATAQFDSTVSKFGTTSMKITTGSSAAYGEVNLYGPFVPATTKNTLIPALPSTTYTISWWMKTEYVSGDASQGATVGLIEFNGVPASTTFNSSVAATIKTTTDWTFYSYSITTQSTTRFFNVQARIYGHNGTGTLQMNAWFDDITLVKSPVQTRTAVTFPQRKTPDNLLSNGNFEYAPPFTAATTSATRWIDGTALGSGNSDSPYKWFVLSSSVSSFSAQFDTSVYRSGTASMKLSTADATGISNVAAGNNANRQSMERTMIPVLPNATYTVTGWVKTNNAATNAVYIDAIEYSGTVLNQATNSTTKLSGTNDWTQLTKTFTTNANTRYLLVVLRNNVAGNISDAWFDDITLTKVPAQTRTVVT